MEDERFEVRTDDARNDQIFERTDETSSSVRVFFEDPLRPKFSREVQRTQEQTRAALVKNGTAVPILENDWSVDRTAQTVAHQFGVTHLEDVQDEIADFCEPEDAAKTDKNTKFTHIHKGPGNGELMDEMRHSQRGKKREQVGIGDRLYFEIEKLLAKFLKSRKRENPEAQNFIHLLSQAIAQEMKRQKDAGGSDKSMNIIFELLKNPSPWIRNWLDMKRRTYRTGGEFENEIMHTIDSETFRFFRMCQGELSPQQIVHQLDTRRRKEKKSAGKRLNELLHEYREARIKARSAVTEEMNGTKMQEVEEEIERLGRVLARYRKLKSELMTRREFLDPDHTPLSPTEFAQRFFQKGFLHEKVDLDAHADIHPEGFIQGFFTEMPKHFKQNSAHLITGVRSDSHESDEDFEQDIAQNLDLLAPGGVLITDGARMSYWRIHRFAHIARALAQKQNPLHKESDFHIDIIVDTQTGLPKSIMIQKRHQQKGFFAATQKAKFIRPDSEIESFEKTLSRTDIAITNDIRYQQKSKGKPQTPQEARRFRATNDTIEKTFAPFRHRALAAATL